MIARYGEDRLALGRAALFEQLAIPVSEPPMHDGPIAGVAYGSRFLGWVLLADEPRPEALEAVANLPDSGFGGRS